MNSFLLFFQREWKLAFLNTGTLILPLCFFVLISLLFPFSLPANNAILSQIGIGVIWVAAVLAILMSLESMFYSDYQDGSLEQWLINSPCLTLAILGKVFAQWSASGLILCLFSPLLCLTLHIPEQQIWVLFISLLLATPSLTLIGAIGAALTVTLQRGGVLLAIIILPLYIPILIYGAGMVSVFSSGTPIEPQIYTLLSILVLSITLAPLAIVAALRTTIT